MNIPGIHTAAPHSFICVNERQHIRLEAFTVTELDKIFSGNKACQLWIKAQRFRDHLHRQGHQHNSHDDGDGDGL
jgi:hypothetical protein